MEFFGRGRPIREEHTIDDSELRKVSRELVKNIQKMEKQEKRFESEIKKLAQQGNTEGCAILARQLIRLKKQKARSIVTNNKVHEISAENKMLSANFIVTNAMATTSKTMGNIDKLMKPEKVAEDVRSLEEADSKRRMTEEMIKESLDDILESTDDETESNKMVNQILDEIGIEVSGQMSKAPSAIKGSVQEESGAPTEEGIENLLSNLKVPN